MEKKNIRKLNPLERHKQLEILMLAIYGNERPDPRLPVCYPYVLSGGERWSLEDAVKEELRFLPRNANEQTRLKIVLELSFGLTDGKPRTLKEVAAELGGVSPSTINNAKR